MLRNNIIFHCHHYIPKLPIHFPFQFSHNFKLCTTTSHSESDSDSFTVSYLINTIGFTRETALKASKRIRIKSPEKPNSVFTFFRNHGFPDSSIKKILIKEPWLLSTDTHNSIRPKFEFFISKGVSLSEVATLLTLMMDYGVCDSSIARVFLTRPTILGTTDLIHTLEEVKGLGFDPSTSTFGIALIAKKCMSKALWDEKVEVFKKWGWSDQAVIQAFRMQPSLMLASIDKINLVMSFWVDRLGWDSLALTRRPQIFGFSLQKRVIPRALLLQYLMMKGLRKKNASLVAPFTWSEKQFLSKYVVCFKDESDYLLKLYEENMNLAYTKENIDMPFTK
ncbi:transcription termination factor MTERF15, mitochondrial [Lathyrus oleraceus]|nr:transcription termination factor MTERF15, mitochondrial-like [Pisum sativum]